MFDFEEPNDNQLSPKEQFIEKLIMTLAAIMLLGFAVKIIFL